MAELTARQVEALNALCALNIRAAASRGVDCMKSKGGCNGIGWCEAVTDYATRRQNERKRK